MEVVRLIGSRIELRVEQTRRKDGIQRIVAVAGRIRRWRDVLVQREVRIVGVVGLGSEEVVLDRTLGRAGVVRKRPGAGHGEVRVVRRVSGNE